MGLIATFKDVQFPNVSSLFKDGGTITDENYVNYVKNSYDELIWMAKALRWGRDNI